MSEKKRPGGHSGEHPWRDDPYSNTQRPPFPKGHTINLRHGAHYEPMLKPVAEQLEREILEVAPWLGRPAFATAVEAWAAAEAVCRAYRAWFFDKGLRDEEGQPVSGLVQWDRAEARAAKLRSRLGLDPTALSKLLAQLAAVQAAGGDSESLEAVKREGAAIVRARERQLAERVENEDERDGDADG